MPSTEPIQSGETDMSEAEQAQAWANALLRWKEQSRNTATTRTVALPDDRLKSKLIGREGRNVAALEESTGCDLLVDSLPGEAQVVSYSPERRLLGELALTNLILEDRIHPDRIREWAAESEEILRRPESMRALGREAVLLGGGSMLSEAQFEAIGRLYDLTEAGQPALIAAIEAARLVGNLLGELNHPSPPACSLAFLAFLPPGFEVDQEQEVILNEVRKEEPSSLVAAALCAAIDAIRHRLGARREGLSPYQAFTHELQSTSEVKHAWLMRRGREVWLFPADPDLSDESATRLVEGIRRSCEYPHAVKTRVVRQPE